MALDQRRHFSPEKFQLLDLERFSRELEYARQIFELAGLQFDGDKFRTFSKRELNKPLRAAKVDSARNSHLFHNQNFVFSKGEIEIIHARINDVLGEYEIDWEQCLEDYLDFHAREKARLGFG
jgi:hypothetical protein